MSKQNKIPETKPPIRLPNQTNVQPPKKNKTNEYIPPRIGNVPGFYANGFSNFIKNPIGTVKEAFSGVPTRLNNISTKTLQEYGNIPIIKIDLARTGLNKIVEGAINTISFGAWNKLKTKHNQPKFYHLSLIATLQNNQKIIVEKNEVIDIRHLQNSSSINASTQYLTIPYNGGLTLNTMIDRTKKAMGDTAFYDYSGLKNNCQTFVSHLLSSSNMLLPWIKDWLYQDVSKIRQELPSHVEPMMDKVTALGSIASRLMAKGKSKQTQKETNDLIKYMKQKNITEDDLMELLKRPEVMKWFHDNNFRFL